MSRTPRHQMVDTGHIPSKRSHHQLVALLGASHQDTKWWRLWTRRHSTKTVSPTPTRYFVILPFKECFLSKFTSLHSQLPEYVHTECPCIFNFSPLCIFVKNAPVLTFSSLNLNLAEDQIVFGTIGKRVVKIKTPSQMDVALWVV